VDAGRVSGRAHAADRLHVDGHEGGCLWGAHPGACARGPGWGVAVRHGGRGSADDGRRERDGVGSGQCEAPPGVLVDRPRRIRARGPRGGHRGRVRRGAVLLARLRGHEHWGLRGDGAAGVGRKRGMRADVVFAGRDCERAARAGQHDGRLHVQPDWLSAARRLCGQVLRVRSGRECWDDLACGDWGADECPERLLLPAGGVCLLDAVCRRGRRHGPGDGGGLSAGYHRCRGNPRGVRGGARRAGRVLRRGS